MEKDTGIPLSALNADGGASRDSFLMQFQADILGRPILRPAVTETTALGAAGLAGLAVGMWNGPEELRGLRALSREYRPQMEADRRQALLRGWHKAVGRSLDWADHE